MSAPLYIFSISLPFVTLLLIFGMRSLASIQQARARLANDDAYRLLAERAANAEGAAAASLAAIQDSLAEVRARLASVEKILKDVE